jgi:hypothetical protein
MLACKSRIQLRRVKAGYSPQRCDISVSARHRNVGYKEQPNENACRSGSKHAPPCECRARQELEWFNNFCRLINENQSSHVCLHPVRG